MLAAQELKTEHTGILTSCAANFPDIEAEPFFEALDREAAVEFGENIKVLHVQDCFQLRAWWPADQTQERSPPRSALLQRKPAVSSLVRECVVCLEEREVIALIPCGHLVCTTCSGHFFCKHTCPVCRGRVESHQSLFG